MNFQEQNMNNLPISTGVPQTAAKPAPASAGIEDATTQGQPFGDVLARQVSDASAAEDTSAPKTISTKSADEIFAHIKSKQVDDAAASTNSNSPSNLPADMMAALVPLGVAVQQNAGGSQGAASAPVPATSQIDTTAPSPTVAQIMPNSVGVENPALPKIKGASASIKANLSDNPEPVDLNTPASNSALAAHATSNQPVIDSKKDAAFSNMLETITAATGAKLAEKDEKSAALAAAPQPNANVQASMQAATTPAAPTSVLPVQVTINTPVLNDKWGDEFNQKITWLSNQKEQTAELHLNPPQLGPMDVVLKVSGDQATALFTSPHAAVREAVEQALPKLREMLAASGIMLGNATVSDQAPRNRQDGHDNKSSNSRSSIGGIADVSKSGNLNVRVSPISRHNGIVDTFA
jgi:flagellar hook-length control protein FliK